MLRKIPPCKVDIGSSNLALESLGCMRRRSRGVLLVPVVLVEDDEGCAKLALTMPIELCLLPASCSSNAAARRSFCDMAVVGEVVISVSSSDCRKRNASQGQYRLSSDESLAAARSKERQGVGDVDSVLRMTLTVQNQAMI